MRKYECGKVINMSFAERFEELRIWQEARAQVLTIYQCIERQSSGYNDFAFRDQLQRASISVMNNIAEGFERKTPKDFAHFRLSKRIVRRGSEYALCCRGFKVSVP